MHPRPALSGARGAVLAAFVTSGMLAVVWIARLPALRDSLALSPSEAGLALLATALGSIAAITVVGRLAVSLGSDVVLRWSLPSMALGVAVIGFSANYAMLLFTAAVTGVFLGATDVTMNAQGSLIERQTGQRVLAGMHAGWSFGSAIGAGLAAVTAALAASVGATTLVASALALAVWLSTRKSYLPDAHPSVSRSEPRSRIRLPRAILVIGAVMTLAYLIEGAVAGWSTLYLHDQFSVAAWLAAAGYLAYEISMVTGRLVGDRLRHRFGDGRSGFVGALLGTVGIGLIVMSPSAAGAVAGLVIVGLGQSVVVPIMFASAGVVTPGLAAAAIARVGGFGYAGVLAGPAAFGFVAESASMRAGFVMLLVLAIVMTAATRRAVPA